MRGSCPLYLTRRSSGRRRPSRACASDASDSSISSHSALNSASPMWLSFMRRSRMATDRSWAVSSLRACRSAARHSSSVERTESSCSSELTTGAHSIAQICHCPDLPCPRFAIAQDGHCPAFRAERTQRNRGDPLRRPAYSCVKSGKPRALAVHAVPASRLSPTHAANTPQEYHEGPVRSKIISWRRGSPLAIPRPNSVWLKKADSPSVQTRLAMEVMWRLAACPNAAKQGISPSQYRSYR